MAPLVAIRCIAYNQEKYIRKALDGFIMQKTNFPFVAIVHDDASTDNTASIIREYAKKYPNIVIPIFETENQYSKPGNPLRKIMRNAIDATGAKYIAICEGDDYWTDSLKLQKQVDFLENHPDYIGCYAEVDCINHISKSEERSQRIVTKWGKIPPSFEEQLMHKYYLAPPTWVYRSSFGRGEKVKDVIDGTYAMSLDFLGQYKFKFINEVFGVYRIVSTGVSHVNKLSDVFKRRKGLWITQREYAKKYSHLISIKNKKKIRTSISNLMVMASVTKDADFLSLCYRYARYTKKYHILLKFTLLKTTIAQLYLKNKYKKKGIIL